MRRIVQFALALAAAVAAHPEIIDRVAVTVDRVVITESDLITHLRVAAFLNGEPVRLTPEAKRQAARQMVEQVLVRREMAISRYPAPSPEDVEPLLESVLKQRGLDRTKLEEALAAYRLTEQDIRESLLLQLTLLRFIEYRFRPGVAVSDEEIEEYYRNEFLPDWERRNDAPPPGIEDVRDEIEEILIERHVDAALDRWLEQALKQAKIEYRREAFQ